MRASTGLWEPRGGNAPRPPGLEQFVTVHSVVRIGLTEVGSHITLQSSARRTRAIDGYRKSNSGHAHMSRLDWNRFVRTSRIFPHLRQCRLVVASTALLFAGFLPTVHYLPAVAHISYLFGYCSVPSMNCGVPNHSFFQNPSSDVEMDGYE